MFLCTWSTAALHEIPSPAYKWPIPSVSKSKISDTSAQFRCSRTQHLLLVDVMPESEKELQKQPKITKLTICFQLISALIKKERGTNFPFFTMHGTVIVHFTQVTCSRVEATWCKEGGSSTWGPNAYCRLSLAGLRRMSQWLRHARWGASLRTA